MKPSTERIAHWAAARSIFGASLVISRYGPKMPELEPRLLPGNRISIGPKGLIFRDSSLLRAIEKGLAMPELRPMFRHPLCALRSIFALRRIARLYDQSKISPNTLSALLRAGLESLAVFGNHDPASRSLFCDEFDELVDFRLDGHGSLGWLCLCPEGAFSAASETPSGTPSVILTFSSREVAFDVILRGMDQLGALATGKVLLQGKIPLMEKIGYLSRVVLGRVPVPVT